MGAQKCEGTVERQSAGVSCKQQLIFMVQRGLMIFREEERIDLNSFASQRIVPLSLNTCFAKSPTVFYCVHGSLSL